MSVKTSVAIAAGVCGGLFVAYCIYFDRKRRSDPEYKEKVRERKFSIDDRQVISFDFTWLWLSRECKYHDVDEFDGKCLKNTTVTVCTVSRR